MIRRQIAAVAVIAALGTAGCIGHGDPAWPLEDSARPTVGDTDSTPVGPGVTPAGPGLTPAGPGPVAAVPLPIVGCTNLALDECDELVARVRARLPAERDGSVVAVEFELGGCGDGIGEGPEPSCPPSLDSRTGQVTVEFSDGDAPLQFTLAGPPDAPQIAPLDVCPATDPDVSCWELMKPKSERVAGSGPFPFQVGHCGLGHIVDFDNGFWVVTGRVDGYPHGSMGLGGEMRLLGPDVAEYREGSAGPGEPPFVARLARYPGPKFIWQWCA